jgi:flagellin-like hook-associated protein FlgL
LNLNPKPESPFLTNLAPIRIGRSILPDHIAVVTQGIRSLKVDFNFDDDSFLSAYSTPPPANNSNNNKKRTYASALSNTSTHTIQPNTISPTTASDLTTERSSRIDKLLAQLATKNTTLEASQTTMQSTQTKLQEQFEVSLERFDSFATKLNYQQSTLESLQVNMATIIKKLDKLDNRATESSSSRKHPRPTPTNTEDFVNQNTLNNLSLNMLANINNMDTDDIPEPDTFYDQADDDPKQDNEQQSRR